MRRLPFVFLAFMAMLAAALPALAQGEDPLAHSVLLDGMISWAMFGLAILFMLLFILWTRRGPH